MNMYTKNYIKLNNPSSGYDKKIGVFFYASQCSFLLQNYLVAFRFFFVYESIVKQISC